MLFLLALIQFNQTRAMELDFRIQPLSEDLATHKAWLSQPNELNPHRRRWILRTEFDLEGLVPVKKSTRKYSLNLERVSMRLFGQIRPPGPWYSLPEQFPCGATSPNSQFATYESTRNTAERALSFFKAHLSAKGVELKKRIRSIEASSAQFVGLLSQAIVMEWLDEKGTEFRKVYERKLDSTEWKNYVANSSEHCKNIARKKAFPKPLATWQEQAEQPEPVAMKWTSDPIRAPAKFWNGALSIRPTLEYPGRRVVGRFVLDPTRKENLVSPIWLRNQGVALHMVRRQSNSIFFPRVEVGNGDLLIRKFSQADVDWYLPPEYVSACCDGLFGFDLFRRWSIEIHPSVEPVVVFHPVNTYRPSPEDWDWLDVTVVKPGVLDLECRLENPFQQDSGIILRLNLGLRETPTEIQWKNMQMINEPSGSTSRVICGQVTAIKNVPKAFVNQWANAKNPIEWGSQFLYRGPMAWDLPHGKIWLSKKWQNADIPINATGISLEPFFVKGQRKIRIVSVRNHEVKNSLKAQGLEEGQEISGLGGKAAENLDVWEMNQYLGGRYDHQVEITWSTPFGSKRIFLPVRNQ